MELNLEELTKDQVGQLLNCSPKSLDNYVKLPDNPLPWHPRGKIKYYVWNEVFEWWIARKTGKAGLFKPKDDLDAAKLAGQNLHNEMDALDLEVKKGNLLEVEDVRKIWSDSLVDIKQSLLNVGYIAATDIIDGMKHSKKKKIIDDLIFSSLNKVIEEAKAIQ